MEQSWIRASVALNNIIVKGNSWKHIFLDKGEVPRVSLSEKIIYTPPFGVLTEEEEDMVWCCCLHENAHAKYTPRDPEPSWSSAMKEIVNSIEDARIEKALGQDFAGAAMKLYKGNKLISNEWDTSMSKDNAKVGALRQALVYCSFKNQNIQPLWTMSKDAKNIYNLIKDIWSQYDKPYNWNTIQGFDNVVQLSERILELVKDWIQNEQNNEQNDLDNQTQSNDNSDNKSTPGNDSSNSKQNLDKSDETSDDQTKDNSKSNSQEEHNSNKEENNNSEKNKPIDKNETNNQQGENNEQNENDSNGGNNSNSNNNNNNNNANNDDGDISDSSNSVSNKQNNTSSKKSKKEVEAKLEEMSNSDMNTLEELTAKISTNSVEANNNYCSDTSKDNVEIPKPNPKKFIERYDKIGSQIAEFSRYLEMALIAKQKIKRFSHREEGKLDRRRLHVAARSLSKKVFYQVKNGEAINTAVTIIVDESGSMWNIINDTASIAIALGECLNRIGIPFEIVGSTTAADNYSLPKGISRTNPITYRFFKSFDEQYDMVKTRLGSLDALEHNTDGEFVENLANRLSKRKEDRKIIFCLSDGEPYAGHPNVDEMGQNLIDVCKRVRASGIELFGIGLETIRPKEFYGDKYFIHIPKIKDLGANIFNLFKTILLDNKRSIG